ncbi:MAG: type II toxin-antitoxin system RelE/ParE family toxin [Candidatus Thorarchaeota archaeon]
MYEIFLSHQAKNFIKNLDEKTKTKLMEVFEILKDIPIPYRHYDVSKIRGRENIYRIRISSLRVLYCIIEIDEKIRILKIGYRENFY